MGGRWNTSTTGYFIIVNTPTEGSKPSVEIGSRGVAWSGEALSLEQVKELCDALMLYVSEMESRLYRGVKKPENWTELTFDQLGWWKDGVNAALGKDA
jgi:hypothetical protein